MSLINAIRRRWSIVPDKKSDEMATYFHTSPRLSGVRVIATNSATAELKLYKKSELRRDGKNAAPLAEHEVYDLLENPCKSNTEIDGYALRFLTFASVELTGEFGWLKVRDGTKVSELLPIPKAWIMQVPTDKDPCFHIMPKGTEGGIVCVVHKDDFVWFKDVNLSDPLGRGKGNAEIIADEVETDEFAAKYQKNFFYNDCTPPFVITGFQGNQQSADEVKKKFTEKLAGFRHAREPAVLTGEQKVQTLGTAPKELDMVESRKFIRDECIQHFQLPPEIMGIIENSNRATIDSAFYLMQKNVILPRLQFFERVINRQLLSEFDDLACRHDYSIAEDEALQLQIYQFGMQNGAISIEEFRSRFGFSDEMDGTFLQPFGMGSSNPTETPVLDLIPDDKKFINVIRKGEEHEQKKTLAIALYEAKATSKENQFFNAVKKIAERQRSDLLKELDAENYQNVLTQYFDMDCAKAVKRGLASCWLASLNDGNEMAKTILERKEVVPVDVVNARFNEWVEKYGLEKSMLMNETTKKELIEEIKKVLSENAVTTGTNELTRLIKEAVDKYFKDYLSDARAKMIARTETGATVNAGQLITYKEYNVSRKEWVSTYDNRARQSHMELGGMVVGIDETFAVPNDKGGVDNMLYPQDPTGSAGNVCNCRCTILPIV